MRKKLKKFGPSATHAQFMCLRPRRVRFTSGWIVCVMRRLEQTIGWARKCILKYYVSRTIDGKVVNFISSVISKLISSGEFWHLGKWYVSNINAKPGSWSVVTLVEFLYNLENRFVSYYIAIRSGATFRNCDFIVGR